MRTLEARRLGRGQPGASRRAMVTLALAALDVAAELADPVRSMLAQAVAAAGTGELGPAVFEIRVC